MKLKHRHSWTLTPKQAIKLQKDLTGEIEYGLKDVCPLNIKDVKYVAGADVSYSKKTDTCYGVVVLFSFPELQVIEEQITVKKSTYPYVPGLLTFREAGTLIESFARLETEPELLVFDGQGVAHPRRMGLAAHMGYLYEKPSIGCAKSRYIGEYKEPRQKAGSWRLVKDEGETIGIVLRSRDGCKPVFISAGHKMDLAWATKFIKRCLGDYRQPPITRIPHLVSNRVRKEYES